MQQQQQPQPPSSGELTMATFDDPRGAVSSSPTTAAAATSSKTAAATTAAGGSHLSSDMYAVEAQWILTVLEDAVQKLQQCWYLTPDIIVDKIMDAVDHEVSLALREHFKLEQQYGELAAARNQQPAEHDDTALEEMEMCLTDSSRTLARLMKSNPMLVRRMKEISTKRTAASLEFQNLFASLLELVHAKLRMTAEEERAKQDELRKLQETEERDSKRFVALANKLQNERNEHIKTIQSKDAKIDRLLLQIEQVERKTTLEASLFEQKMKVEADAAEAAFVEEESQLLAQLEQLRAQIDKESAANYVREQKEHRNKFHREDEIQAIVAKFDEDMSTKHAALNELQETFATESARLTELADHFHDVDTQAAAECEELAQLQIRRDQQVVEDRKRYNAAVLMQKLYRGFATRRAVPVDPKTAKKK